MRRMAAGPPLRRRRAAASSSPPWWTPSWRSWWRRGGEAGAKSREKVDGGETAGRLARSAELSRDLGLGRSPALLGAPPHPQKRPIWGFCSYQRFANCYRDFYRLQPELTRSIYDQFVSQLQASIKEEIQEVKEEGNLEALFNSLDKIVEEAKEQEEPAWRPSGIPEEDVRSAMVPYLLKHRAYLRKVLKEKEEENRKLAEAVLAGRDRIAELQRLIQDRKQAWQVKPSHLCAEAASV
uniref:Polyamine modulated factor 1 n=2 Tax=Casuariiformes TaxID=8784 RepID=A0A8C4K560_DRONO